MEATRPAGKRDGKVGGRTSNERSVEQILGQTPLLCILHPAINRHQRFPLIYWIGTLFGQ